MCDSRHTAGQVPVQQINMFQLVCHHQKWYHKCYKNQTLHCPCHWSIKSIYKQFRFVVIASFTVSALCCRKHNAIYNMQLQRGMAPFWLYINLPTIQEPCRCFVTRLHCKNRRVMCKYDLCLVCFFLSTLSLGNK